MRKRTSPAGRAFEMLRAANPVEVEELRREPRDAALAAVRERILVDVAPGSLRPSRSRLVRLGAAGGATAAIIAALLALLPSEEQQSTGVRLLEAAAATAAAQPSVTPRPGAYAYVKERATKSEDREGRLRKATAIREWWIAADGSGRIVDRGRRQLGGVPLADGRSEPSNPHLCLPPEGPVQGWDPATAPPGLKVCVQNIAPVIDARFADGQFADLYEERSPNVLGLPNGKPRRVDTLPTDPDALQRALEGELDRANSDDPDLDTGFRSGFPREEQLLILIAQTLAHPLASPELRGALYDVASRLDRVKVTEGVKDPAGRPATSITLKRSAIHYGILFDPATSELLATGSVAYDPGLRYSDYTLYLERATVSSIRERP